MEDKSVFFLSNIFNEKKAIGITKKVHHQIVGLKNLGYNHIFYTSYYNDFLAVLDQNNNIIYKKSYILNNKFLRKYFKNYELKKFAKQFLDNYNQNYEFIYTRYMFFDSMFLSFLKSCKKRTNRIVIEAHSYPIYNKIDFLYYPIYLQDYIYTTKCAKYLDLVLAISDKSSIWNTKTVQIDNAIVIDDYKISKRSYTYNDDINLIFVGYEYNVHGLDRLIKGLHKYYSLSPQKKVNLILVGKMTKKTMNLIKKYNMSEYIKYLGIKCGEELDNIFDYADIGIGILAPYRRNSSLGTGLKTKEYMARGLPIVYAGKSISIKGECNFIYSLPNNNSIIDINSIIDFYNNIYTITDMHYQIRNLVSNLTWENQFEKMINNFQ
ncbi:MAG: glycosyltransferase [Coprobacillus cateniformis]|uniref:glycosyltransferase n=3 Tax=Coprobacillus cateniformis TaxID=100884 RepID=UPI000E43B2ED|nr:glycosyltransferase [Coprobacillus cateniformis]RGO08786.1 glycosyltransferase [Coprobacillus cateniformis]RGO18189.1 glycosyltransferase [Coprobacillus cateniformis]